MHKQVSSAPGPSHLPCPLTLAALGPALLSCWRLRALQAWNRTSGCSASVAASLVTISIRNTPSTPRSFQRPGLGSLRISLVLPPDFVSQGGRVVRSRPTLLLHPSVSSCHATHKVFLSPPSPPHPPPQAPESGLLAQTLCWAVRVSQCERPCALGALKGVAPGLPCPSQVPLQPEGSHPGLSVHACPTQRIRLFWGVCGTQEGPSSQGQRSRQVSPPV